jgi:homoserine dehydrogenase
VHLRQLGWAGFFLPIHRFAASSIVFEPGGSMLNDIIVLKFGSSVLRSPADLPTAVHEIYRWYRAGWRVVVVASAMGETTERLLSEARELVAEPQPHATAELLATGERHSTALLGVALDRAGIPARVVDPREISLTASGTVLDSEPSALDAQRFNALLDETPVIVVPGFFGYGADGRLHLLGRGGSDLSAVYLAKALNANRCRLVKDVDGVYESDPAEAHGASLQRFSALGYSDAIEHAAPLIQPKAVQFLDRNAAHAEVASIASPYESVIGQFDRTLVKSKRPAPTSVMLLGLGTVGMGVYQRLRAMPEHFHIVGALVRDRTRHEAAGVAPELLHESADSAKTVRADIVVDALPGLEPSHELVRHFIEQRTNVVSANKTVIAETGPALGVLAAKRDVYLEYSAAVGGSTPMIETLRREMRHNDIGSIAGILNGTCNYMLERCSEGLTFEEALRDAHERGFAEADPTEDLSGRDAARKLRILARHAFGQDPTAFNVEPLSATTLARSRAQLQPDETLRMIARAWKISSTVFGQIQLEAVAAGDPFAQTRGEWNRLVIKRVTGDEITVTGRGAGRWPTSEAIVADLLDVRFAQLALTPPPIAAC